MGKYIFVVFPIIYAALLSVLIVFISIFAKRNKKIKKEISEIKEKNDINL